MGVIRSLARIGWRLAVVWLIDTISLLITAAIVPGLSITANDDYSQLAVAAAAALVLGIVNLLIRPLILLLALPFGFFVIFGVGFFVNALVLMITGAVLQGFNVDGLIPAILGGLLLGAINAVITTILDLDDSSFYSGMADRLARRGRTAAEMGPGRGLLMLEVDGLSYWHIHKALEQGKMPTFSKLMKERGYQLSRIDCGLPSQTSACQAGIMFGDNDDIPSFRWYDKTKKKLYVSTTDASSLNARYAKGNGIMRGGTSINNLMCGDAEKSLLTFANLTSGSDEEKKRRADDIYLMMLNPYFFMRTIAIYIWHVFVELWEGFKQERAGVEPRLNRRAHFYPFVRAATTAFMPKVSEYLISLDMVRGSPAIYNTYVGYDEVAHHSGTWAGDAFHTLRQFDSSVRRLLDVAEKRAPRQYELIVLSDHGQSFGATFKQRYGRDLKTFIQEQLPSDATVHQSSGGDDGTMGMRAMSSELANVQEQGVGGNMGKAVVKRTERAFNDAADRQMTVEGASHETASLVVCGSGNLAQVYVTNLPNKPPLSQLNALYPGVVDALVNHEGIGFVVAYEDDGAPVALGKGGRRNLYTGEVQGNDPLTAYASDHSPVEFRAAQVRRLADFPHSGDVIVNSTLYPDGTVAAMEELIGSHGGLGGEQTDAFIFHPPDMNVPPTSNSADVFAILNARRGLPEIKAATQLAPVTRSIDAWAPGALIMGLSRVKRWVGVALRCIALDASAFREAAINPYLTGPALMISLLAAVIGIFGTPVNENAPAIVIRFVAFLLIVLLITAAGRILGGRASFTDNFRAAGFALSASLLSPLALIEPFAPIVRVVITVLTLIGMWIGASEANKVSGWKTLLFPVVIVGVAVIATIAAGILAGGLSLTVEAMQNLFGLTK
jgi:uncharacterized membrane protein YvlD (DUF360 family)